jgi:hypothetical protein
MTHNEKQCVKCNLIESVHKSPVPEGYVPDHLFKNI